MATIRKKRNKWAVSIRRSFHQPLFKSFASKQDAERWAVKTERLIETEYTMSLDGSDELTTGLNISKNINGFDIKVGSNYSLMSQIPDYGVNLEISNKF